MNRCMMNDHSRRLLFAALNERGVRDRWQRLAVASAALGCIVSTYTDLTDDDAATIVARIPSIMGGGAR